MTHPAAIIAGGGSRRMGGGDKFLLELDGRSMLSLVIERLAPQASPLAIVANCDPARLAEYPLPVIPDGRHPQRGPLSGVLAAMDWAASLPDSTHVLTVAADTPFFPADLATRLSIASAPGRIAVASSNSRAHPVFALWPVALRGALDAFLACGDNASVMGFIKEHPHLMVDFAADPDDDPFFNVNTPDDLVEATRRAQAGA